jgi:hypothetical protein
VVIKFIKLFNNEIGNQISIGESRVKIDFSSPSIIMSEIIMSEALPSEIFAEVMSWLSYPEAARTSGVCRWWWARVARLHAKFTGLDRLIVNIRARRVGYLAKHFDQIRVHYGWRAATSEVVRAECPEMIEQYAKLLSGYAYPSAVFETAVISAKRGHGVTAEGWKLAEKVFAMSNVYCKIQSILFAAEIGVNEFVMKHARMNDQSEIISGLINRKRFELADALIAKFGKPKINCCVGRFVGVNNDVEAIQWILKRWPGEYKLAMDLAMMNDAVNILEAIIPLKCERAELKRVFGAGLVAGSRGLMEFAIGRGFRPRAKWFKFMVVDRNPSLILEIMQRCEIPIDYAGLFEDCRIKSETLARWTAARNLVPEPERIKPILFNQALRLANFDQLRQICESWPGDEPPEPEVAVIKLALDKSLLQPIRDWWPAMGVHQVEELYKRVFHAALFTEHLGDRAYYMNVLEFMEQNWP